MASSDDEVEQQDFDEVEQQASKKARALSIKLALGGEVRDALKIVGYERASERVYGSKDTSKPKGDST